MKILFRVLFAALLALSLRGWFISRRNFLSAVVYIQKQGVEFKDANQRLSVERDYLRGEVERLQQLVATTVYNNGEIMEAARAGQVDRAFRKRAEVLKSIKKSGGKP